MKVMLAGNRRAILQNGVIYVLGADDYFRAIWPDQVEAYWWWVRFMINKTARAHEE